MKRQALVVGLGQFGMAVARSLATKQVEVLAVDVHEERVRRVSAFVAEAACLDATEEAALARTSPDRRDVCICAIGDESKEASIICTALLKQMGAKRIIARSNDELHGRILSLIGANEVVSPEREFGDRFANQILHERIRGEMPLGQGVTISEITVPPGFVGRRLSELHLPRRFGVTVVAIRENASGAVVLPKPDSQLRGEDVLVVVAKDQAAARLAEEN